MALEDRLDDSLIPGHWDRMLFPDKKRKKHETQRSISPKGHLIVCEVDVKKVLVPKCHASLEISDMNVLFLANHQEVNPSQFFVHLFVNTVIF